MMSHCKWKMADNEVVGLYNAQILDGSIGTENIKSCKRCEGLKVKLQEALVELSSAREIIRVFQENGSYGVRAERRITRR
jgi:hypothetical protein